jgi:asparagine synthase (glutamine-hydrolysing)
MRVFLCLLDPSSRGIPDQVLRAYESFPRGRGLQFEWHRFPQAAVLVAWDDGCGDALVACDGTHLAVGVVRLDNRAEIEEWTGLRNSDATDLEVVLRAVAQLGTEYVARILGDFAFVVWDGTTRTGVAACDALAVKKLYWAEDQGLLAFSGRAEAIGLGERYSIRFLAERVAGCEVDPRLTAYDTVRAIPGGSLVLLEHGNLTERRYWSAEEIEPSLTRTRPVQETVAMFRHLLTEAVRSRLSTDGPTWAQLSGGLDSSSVASITQGLARTGAVRDGLAGTVTYVDREGTAADERAYSNIVVRALGLRNEAIVDPPIWIDASNAPPRVDQPRLNFMFYPREYRLCDIVRRNGGDVLLTGQGPDEYLRGTMFFFADWIARGQLGPAVREMARWAAIGRVSFWELAYRNAVTPLLPGVLRRWLGPEVTRLPPWIHPRMARRYELRDRAYEFALYEGRLGEKYRTSMVKGVAAVRRTIGHLILDDKLDVRHPFLDRRLVEFSLRLPPEMTAQPYAGKWVLREAMRDIVPEAVRTRVGKGTLGERHAWALTAQRSLLEPLVQEPILADLGIVDGAKLRAAFDAAPQQAQRKGDPHAALQQVLAIEAWLQIRVGRWPRGLPQ